MSELSRLLEAAKAHWESLTPEQKLRQLAAQRRSYVVGEAGFGSDEDEAKYAAAVAAGDRNEVQRLHGEATARMERARQILDREGL